MIKYICWPTLFSLKNRQELKSNLQKPTTVPSKDGKTDTFLMYLSFSWHAFTPKGPYSDLNQSEDNTLLQFFQSVWFALTGPNSKGPKIVNRSHVAENVIQLLVMQFKRVQWILRNFYCASWSVSCLFFMLVHKCSRRLSEIWRSYHRRRQAIMRTYPDFFPFATQRNQWGKRTTTSSQRWLIIKAAFGYGIHALPWMNEYPCTVGYKYQKILKNC